MLNDPSKDWGVRELSRLLNMPPSTVHRLLVALDKEGLLNNISDVGRYRIGLEFYRMLWKAEAQFPVREIVLPHLRNIVSVSNETAFLGLYDSTRMEMIFTDSVDSKHSLRYVVPLNEWIPVYCAASGMAILAFLPTEERQHIVEKTRLAPITEFTIIDPSVLENELDRIRRQGYAISHGQRIPGAVGIATPFWGAENRVIGDLVVTIPEQRFDKQEVQKLAQLLIDHAQQITAEILGARN